MFIVVFCRLALLYFVLETCVLGATICLVDSLLLQLHLTHVDVTGCLCSSFTDFLSYRSAWENNLNYIQQLIS